LALENLVQLAIDEAVRVVLIAGDIFDGDWQDWHTGQFFVRQLARLDAAGIRVVAISGNHDAASVITRRLDNAWPKTARMLGHKKPETVSFDDLDLSIHGQSFATKSVTDNLVANYPRPIARHLNIGLLHTALEGRPGHEPYAPCTIAQLRDFGYDYWALGHVHQREVIDEKPWIVFPGNLQARHINEAGEKGATLITVENHAITSVEHRVLDVVRWQRVPVDVGACATLDDVETALIGALRAAAEHAPDRLLAARPRLTGATAAHGALRRDPGAMTDRLRNVALGAFAPDAVWLEKIEIATTPLHDAGTPDPDTAPLLHLLAEAEPDMLVAALRDWAAESLAKAPGLRDMLPADHPMLQLANAALNAETLTNAQALIRAQLSEGSDAPG